MPKVSVVMCTYNDELFIKQAVESVLQQTFSDFELIVVNDGSTDNTQKILENFCDNRLVLVMQDNQGAVSATNKGLKLAKGEYIARHDGDDVSDKNRLEEQVLFLDSNIEFGLVGTDAYVTDDKERVLYKKGLVQGDNLREGIFEKNYVTHGSIMFRREFLDRIGLLRKEFECAHDYDFILRIAELSKIENLSKVLYMHRLNDRGISVNQAKRMEKEAELSIEISVNRRNGEPENLEEKYNKMLDALGEEGVFAKLFSFFEKRNYLAGNFYCIACIRFCYGDVEQARNYVVKTIRQNPFFAKAYVLLIFTFLFKSWQDKLKHLFKESVEIANSDKGIK